MSIVVQRSGALGDVVLTTPIVRRLRRENPQEPIAVLTACTDVYQHNPHLAWPVSGGYAIPGTRHIQLNLAYERQPDLPIVRAYMLTAFGDPGDPADLQPELFYPRRQLLWRHRRRFVAVHAATAGWVNRTLPRATWQHVLNGLRRANLWPILVGTSRDDVPGYRVTRFFDKPLLAQAQLIASCHCFVGSDSSLLHVAGATEVPIVGVFTCAKPETRLPWRHGELGWHCLSVVPELDCTGCLARRPPPVTDEFCPRGDTVCVTTVRPEAVIEAVITAVDAHE